MSVFLFSVIFASVMLNLGFVCWLVWTALDALPYPVVVLLALGSWYPTLFPDRARVIGEARG